MRTKFVIMLILITFVTLSTKSYAEELENYEMDPYSWGYDIVNADIAKLQGYTGKGVNIAVLDSGIDVNHPNIGDNIVGGANCLERDSNGKCKDGIPSVDYNYWGWGYHGTAVASVMVGLKDGKFPGGVAPDANIYSIKTIDEGNRADIEAAKAGVQWAIDTLDDDDENNDIDIINMSMAFYEGFFTNDDEYEALCDLAYERGILLVAGSGNDDYGNGLRPRIQMEPSVYESVIAVGGIDSQKDRYHVYYYDDPNDENEPMFEGSNSGSHLDLAAPGESLYLPYGDCCNYTKTLLNGTSFSTPYVSGIAALYKEKFKYANAKELRSMLIEQAEDIGEEGKDDDFGYGLVNAVPPLFISTNVSIQYNKNSPDKWYSNPWSERYQDVLFPNGGIYRATEGKNWLPEKNRFEWYKIQNPLTDEFRWTKSEDVIISVNEGFGETNVYPNEAMSGIYSQGLTDNVSGRIVSNTFGSGWLYDNSFSNNSIAPNAVSQYRFEQPVKIKKVFGESSQSLEKILVEFLDKNGQVITQNFLTNVKNGNKIQDLVDPIEGVYGVRIKNTGTTNVSAIEFEFFGWYSKSAYSEEDISIEFNLSSNGAYVFYDDPFLKTNPLTKTGISGKKAITSKGFYWLSSKNGFKWYKVSIPEIGIENKWVEVAEGGSIHTQGLQDKVAGRAVVANGYATGDLSDNSFGNSFINPNNQGQYRFEKPVNVNHLFVKKGTIDLDENFKIKLEFLDENYNVIGTKTLTNDDYFKEYINLDEAINGVYGYKVTNLGTVSKFLNEIELFGTYDKIAVPEEDINIEFSISGIGAYIFYDDPILKNNQVTKTGINGKKAITSKGFYWLSSKNGYKWYKVSIPEIGITDKWVEVTEGGGIYTQGLLDKVAGRVIVSNNLATGDFFDNSFSVFGVSPNSYGQYRLEKPANVDHLFVKKYTLDMDENFKLKIEFLDENYNVIDTKTFTNDDYFKEYIKLDESIDGVYGFRVMNAGTVSKSMLEVELFGTYAETAFSEDDINIEFNLTSNGTYTFYDDPVLKTGSVIKTGISGKKATTSKGFYWLGSKNGYKWYKVSIPEIGIVNKWVEVNEGGNIFSQGLLDKVAGRVVVSNNQATGDFFNNLFTAFGVSPNSYGQYRLEQPVNVDHLFVKKYTPDMDENFKLKVEFLDENYNVIGTKTFTNDDYFKEYIKLDESIDGVYGFRVMNAGTVSKSMLEIELFGSYDKTAVPEEDINIEFNLTGSGTYNFYDDPVTKAGHVSKTGINGKKAITSKGFYWLSSKNGYKWYKVSISEIGITDKWVEVNEGGGIYTQGLLDKIGGQVVISNGVNISQFIDNSLSNNWLSPNKEGQYRFAQPVNVKHLFIKKGSVDLDENFKMKLEFLDENDNVIGVKNFTNDDYFKEYFKLDETINGVYGFRIKNEGTVAKYIPEIEFY
ncbi:S8 family peptidase [Neobacillus drentensis]|uniref:S8 family peptidase n=1 Tax=Neobacillus drentensis TaxID=220684 RepID=UPI002855BBFC|nr:S8 family serine peptidase [Neobacillus drentensis]MDR7237313.1 hypothetical protein [Neobacillus drentensis]